MNDISESEKARKKSEIQKYQFELFSLQSDEKKSEKKRVDLEVEIRQIKLQINHLSVEMALKEKSLEIAKGEEGRIIEEIKRIKKLMNTL